MLQRTALLCKLPTNSQVRGIVLCNMWLTNSSVSFVNDGFVYIKFASVSSKQTAPRLFLVTVFIYVIHTNIYVQGVTGGTDQTSGGCSLC